MEANLFSVSYCNLNICAVMFVSNICGVGREVKMNTEQYPSPRFLIVPFAAFCT